MMDAFIAKLSDLLTGRFVPVPEDTVLPVIRDNAPEGIALKHVMRFTRKLPGTPAERCYCKTLLIAVVSGDALMQVFEWAALSKEILLDPETADLYLFLLWEDGRVPSMEECLKIESSEEFCRKYVHRPGEDLDQMLDRTFLRQIEQPERIDLVQDPLIAAFAGMESEFSWFDEREKERWLSALHSGSTGFDLFDTLMQTPDTDNAAS